MSEWRSTKARRVLAALLKIGWRIKRQSGSHKTLSRSGWSDFVFAFHDNEEIGPACWHASPNQPAYRLTICNSSLQAGPLAHSVAGDGEQD